jgi:hypothetical protein
MVIEENGIDCGELEQATVVDVARVQAMGMVW